MSADIDVTKEFRKTEEFHVTASKGWLIREIRRCGAKAGIGHDIPTDQAVALVEADPRNSFPIGTADKCDNHDGFGNCLGHPVTTAKLERCSCPESLKLREELASAAAHIATLLTWVFPGAPAYARDQESARAWLTGYEGRLP